MHRRLSRDSIILWAITSHRRVRREYRRIFDDGDLPHLRVIELRGPAEAEAFVASRVALALSGHPNRSLLAGDGEGIADYDAPGTHGRQFVG